MNWSRIVYKIVSGFRRWIIITVDALVEAVFWICVAIILFNVMFWAMGGYNVVQIAP